MTETTTDYMDASEITEAGWYWYRSRFSEGMVFVEDRGGQFIVEGINLKEIKDAQLFGPFTAEMVQGVARLRAENERLREVRDLLLEYASRGPGQEADGYLDAAIEAALETQAALSGASSGREVEA